MEFWLISSAEVATPPAFAAFAGWLARRIDSGCRERLNGTAAEQERLFAAVREAFYAKPLADMRPDVHSALKRLPDVLRQAAATVADGTPVNNTKGDERR